jgi:hypothetical protein
MPGRLRRRSGFTELTADEGPFVSFTDLFIGILFLFLILVAALMLMHQEAVQKAEADAQAYKAEMQSYNGVSPQQVLQMQAKLDANAKLNTDHPPFRLAMVFNFYQTLAGAPRDWTFYRTVQVFRAPDDLCLNNIIFRNDNLSLAWKPPIKEEDIPTAESLHDARLGTPCRLSASGEHWSSETETRSVERTSADLYSGFTILHKKDGDERLNIQYRVLGIYDDYFRQHAGRGAP